MHRQPLRAPLALAAALGCAPHAPPPPSWTPEDPAAAVEREAELARSEPRSRALHALRAASMALAAGDAETAERWLRAAVAVMQDFRAEGEFVAMVGAEEAKEWKGEPYEKMAAFLALGALLWQSGDRDNALAMFRSAVLADTGTTEERFRADFVPALVLQALAWQAEGEPEHARTAMERAVDARWSRATVRVLSRALQRARVPERDPDAVEAARAVLRAALSAGATARPRDLDEAVRATLSVATDLARQQRDLAPPERLVDLQPLSRSDFDAAFEALPALAEAWRAELDHVPADWDARPRAFAERMEALLREPPDLVVLVERGRGPHKFRRGRYGELLAIEPGEAPPGPPRASVDGRPVPATWLDSLTYQATTRGGRRVDAFLRGKAVYKDVSLVTGRVLLDVAADAWAHDQDQLATATALVGLVALGTGLATTPRADVREWGLVPEEWVLVAGRFGPGRHALEVDGRRLVVEVPERGEAFRYLPAIAAGAPPSRDDADAG